MVAPLIGAALIGGGTALLGGMLSSRSQKGISQQDTEYQREFAKYGIRWRVNDARRAGIHPLAALGANVPTYTPTRRVGTDYGISKAGQSVSNYMAQRPTPQDRHLLALDIAKSEQELLTMEKQNKLLDMEINQMGQGTSMPITNPSGVLNGQKVDTESPDPSVIREVPVKAVKSKPGVEGGIGSMFQHLEDENGWVRIMYSQSASEPMESSVVAKVTEEIRQLVSAGAGMFYYRNPYQEGAKAHRQLIRKLMPRQSPGPGMEWRYNPYVRGYKPFPKEGRLYWKGLEWAGQRGEYPQKKRRK